MQPNDTLPVIPYPAFLVGRYAAQTMEMLREAEVEKGVKPIEETLPTEEVNPPDLPKTALLETSRTTEAALLSNLSEQGRDQGKEQEKPIIGSLAEETYNQDEAQERQLDIYT